MKALTYWLVFVALTAGAGGGFLTYAACSGLSMSSGPCMLMALIGAVVAATPYLAVVAFMDLASEAGQGVTWIANFLSEQN